MNETLAVDPLDEELDELMQFFEDNLDMDEDTFLDELERRFSREAIDAVVAAFTGITPQ